MWVIAHECGHQAFSKWQAVNDGVGLVLHSLLLVPYYSWCATCEVLCWCGFSLQADRMELLRRKHSHRRHHSNTANIERDEVSRHASSRSAFHPHQCHG